MRPALTAAMVSLFALTAINPASAQAPERQRCWMEGQGTPFAQMVCDTYKSPPAPTAPATPGAQGIDIGAFRRGAAEARQDQMQDQLYRQQLELQRLQMLEQQRQPPSTPSSRGHTASVQPVVVQHPHFTAKLANGITITLSTQQDVCTKGSLAAANISEQLPFLFGCWHVSDNVVLVQWYSDATDELLTPTAYDPESFTFHPKGSIKP